MNNLDTIITKGTVWSIVGVAIALGVAEIFVGEFIPDRIYIIALLTLALSVFTYAAKIEPLRDRIAQLERKVGGASFQLFTDNKEFYAALKDAVSRAKNELLLTHARTHPPSAFGSGERYFDFVKDWAEKHPDGKVQRIGSRCSPEMREWCEEQAVFAKARPNFYFRALSNKVSLVNFAIIDNQMMFFSIPAETPEGTSGYFFMDPEFVLRYRDYFAYLWNSATEVKADR